ncbi:hypothetical protein cand_035380, partial [Cryptosporidium andersoni]
MYNSNESRRNTTSLIHSARKVSVPPIDRSIHLIGSKKSTRNLSLPRNDLLETNRECSNTCFKGSMNKGLLSSCIGSNQQKSHRDYVNSSELQDTVRRYRDCYSQLRQLFEKLKEQNEILQSENTKLDAALQEANESLAKSRNIDLNTLNDNLKYNRQCLDACVHFISFILDYLSKNIAKPSLDVAKTLVRRAILQRIYLLESKLDNSIQHLQKVVSTPGLSIKSTLNNQGTLSTEIDTLGIEKSSTSGNYTSIKDIGSYLNVKPSSLQGFISSSDYNISSMVNIPKVSRSNTLVKSIEKISNKGIIYGNQDRVNDRKYPSKLISTERLIEDGVKCNLCSLITGTSRIPEEKSVVASTGAYHTSNSTSVVISQGQQIPGTRSRSSSVTSPNNTIISSPESSTTTRSPTSPITTRPKSSTNTRSPSPITSPKSSTTTKSPT